MVWSCSAVRLSAGCCDYVSTGQCVQLLLIRRPMQHKMSLNEDVVWKGLEAGTRKDGQVSLLSLKQDIQKRNKSG